MNKIIFNVLVLLTLTHGAWVDAAAPVADSAPALLARYESLKVQLANNPFQLPLYLDSKQHSGDLRGDIFAVVDHPFATVSTSVRLADQWCAILLLHLNVKYCRATQGGSKLAVYIGRKYDQPLESAHKVVFSHAVAAARADYLQVILHAQKGPFNTSNYRIMLEAVPLHGKTFLHLSYSYGYGMLARLATEAYFSTTGSDKVGFTIIGKRPDGQPVYVDDIRGALERNTMRYYFALDAYLDALSVPPQEQFEKRLSRWFGSTEKYPLQLRETTQKEYLEMKRKEYKRQQTAPPSSFSGG